MQKIKKHHYGFISSQNETGQAESDTKKKKLSFRSIPNRLRIGNFKKITKNIKKLKNIIMDSFVAKRGRDRLRVIQKKSYHFDPFQPDPK